MNAGGVDWDLLADHLGGALEGAERDRVAHLIATDPRWAAAAARLSAALSAVAADLAALPPVTMPDDVTARLDRALRQPTGPVPAPRRDGIVGVGAAASAPGRRADRRRDATRPATGTGPADTGPGRSQRRRLRVWGGLAVAMGTAAVVLAAVQTLGLPGTSGDGPDELEVTLGQPETVEVTPFDTLGVPLLVATRTDYRLDQLPPAPEMPAPPSDSPGITSEGGGVFGHGAPGSPNAPRAADAVPEALAALWASPQRCLTQVVAGYAPRAVAVEAVDFAWVDGEPAVLVWVADPEGARWVTVAGPACGTPGMGADERHRVPLR